VSVADDISKNCPAFNFKTKHSLLDLEVEGSTMIQNVGNCEEIFLLDCFLTLEMRALQSFKTTCPQTQHCIPEYPKLRQKKRGEGGSSK